MSYRGLAIAAVLLVAATGCGPKVYIDYDQNYPFEKIQTFIRDATPRLLEMSEGGDDRSEEGEA